MHWLHSHMYTAACALIGLIVVAGAIVVVQHGPVAPSGALVAWGGSGTSLLNPTSYAPSNPVLNTTNSGEHIGGATPSFNTIPPSPVVSGDTGTDQEFDMNALLAMLAGPSPADTSATGGSSLAYSFIPRGLISTTTAIKKRTELQESLYDYGNEVGEQILSYEYMHSNDSIALTDQARDRQNVQKAQAVRDIGTSLTVLGKKIADTERVPAPVTSMHESLAASYGELGAKLAKIPDAQRDEDFIRAINEYNAAAETFTKRYVDLATYFSLSGVTFGTGDGGSVFMFSGGGSL